MTLFAPLKSIGLMMPPLVRAKSLVTSIAALSVFSIHLIGLSALAQSSGVLPPVITDPSGASVSTQSVSASPASEKADQALAESLTWAFRNQFKSVLDEAKAYLDQQGGNRFRNRSRAVVLDLDETLLDNRAYFIVHKRYDPGLWDQWMAKADAPALTETLSFVDWLRQKGYRIYYVSGRKEAFRAATEENLRRIGAGRYDGLYLKPNNFSGASAANFKVEARRDIEAKGQKVVLILGDQQSDLNGGYGKGFKLPNPIYTIP
jgi:5'-nucleotidase (lipoprotein e(P4) family)